jgi:hypothetical protein
MKRFFLAIAAITAVALFAPGAKATPLSPGQSVSPPLQTMETGTLLASSTQSFTLGRNATLVSGTLTDMVFRESGGTLDFVYQLSISKSGAQGSIAQLGVSDFSAPVTTDVFQSNVMGSNSAFSKAMRSLDGASVLFTPATPFTAGNVSSLAIVKTNATSFDQDGSVTLITGLQGVIGISGTFEPIAPVPEPVTMALWGGSFVGLACTGALQRRKTRA